MPLVQNRGQADRGERVRDGSVVEDRRGESQPYRQEVGVDVPVAGLGQKQKQVRRGTLLGRGAEQGPKVRLEAVELLFLGESQHFLFLKEFGLFF